jgi:hypothetical protein
MLSLNIACLPRFDRVTLHGMGKKASVSAGISSITWVARRLALLSGLSPAISLPLPALFLLFHTIVLPYRCFPESTLVSL